MFLVLKLNELPMSNLIILTDFWLRWFDFEFEIRKKNDFVFTDLNDATLYKEMVVYFIPHI
jgi:hypothetical protein